MVLVVVLIFVVVFPAVHFLGKAYAPVSDQDVIAFGILHGAAPTSESARLYRAYLSRARRYRTTVSVAAWMSAIFLTFALGGSKITIGIGGNNAWSDLLLTGLGGYLAGAVLAETHHLRRRPGGARTASLSRRDVDDYVPAQMRRALQVIEVLSIVFTAVTAVAVVVSPHAATAAALAFSAAALGVCGIVELAVRAVARRPRPALSEDLAVGDDAIRGTAARTLMLGGTGLGVLLLGWACSTVPIDSGTAWAWGFLFATIAALIIGAAYAFRARRLVWPLRKIELEGARA